MPSLEWLPEIEICGVYHLTSFAEESLLNRRLIRKLFWSRNWSPNDLEFTLPSGLRVVEGVFSFLSVKGLSSLYYGPPLKSLLHNSSLPWESSFFPNDPVLWTLLSVPRGKMFFSNFPIHTLLISLTFHPFLKRPAVSVPLRTSYLFLRNTPRSSFVSRWFLAPPTEIPSDSS